MAILISAIGKCLLKLDSYLSLIFQVPILKEGAHETRTANDSAVRVPCPASFNEVLVASGTSNSVPDASFDELTPLPEFSSQFSQFSRLDNSQIVVADEADDFVPQGKTEIIKFVSINLMVQCRIRRVL